MVASLHQVWRLTHRWWRARLLQVDIVQNLDQKDPQHVQGGGQRVGHMGNLLLCSPKDGVHEVDRAALKAEAVGHLLLQLLFYLVLCDPAQPPLTDPGKLPAPVGHHKAHTAPEAIPQDTAQHQ